MTGLEKIIDRIAQDSGAKCDSIILEAQNEATKLKEEAAVVAKKEAEAIVLQAEKDAESAVALAETGSEAEGKKQILATKIHIINKAIEAASDKLSNLPDDEYFATLYRLVKANAQEADGVMLLSAKDLARLPSDFKTQVDAAAKGKITVSDKASDIANGFILVYGDVEINCTFDALISDMRDDIKDQLYSIIFA